VLLNTVEEFKGRVWIPYRVAYEYHRRINDVIGDQVRAYEETKSALKRFQQLLDAKRGHPFLTKELHAEVAAFCEKMDKALCDKALDVEKLFADNPTKTRLAELLDGQVGDGLKKEEMDTLI